MMDYACPARRFAESTHVWRLQVLKSKCLRFATGATWYVGGRQVHEDGDVPKFADYIGAPNTSFDSKLADVRNPLFRQLGRYLCWPRVEPRCLTRKPMAAAVSKPVEVTARRCPSRLNESCSALISRAPLGCPDRGFYVIFTQL
jgi:hypothetical protein